MARIPIQPLSSLQLAEQVVAAGLPKPEVEHCFHPTRKWRLDLAFPEHKLAVEIEGGVFASGGHVWPTGFMKDLEKYNELAILGYRLIRVTPRMVKRRGEAVEWIRRALEECSIEGAINQEGLGEAKVDKGGVS